VQYIKGNNYKLYAPNVNAPNFIKHTLKDLKAHIDSNTVVLGDFNASLSPIDRSSKQKINREILEQNDIINQMDLTNVYRIFHQQYHNVYYSQQPMELSSKWVIS
jgi:hypothetical protein